MKVTVKMTKKWKKKSIECVEKSKNSRIIILIYLTYLVLIKIEVPTRVYVCFLITC